MSASLQCAVWGLEVPSGQLHRLVSRSGFVAQGPSIFLAVILGDSAKGATLPDFRTARARRFACVLVVCTTCISLHSLSIPTLDISASLDSTCSFHVSISASSSTVSSLAAMFNFGHLHASMTFSTAPYLPYPIGASNHRDYTFQDLGGGLPPPLTPICHPSLLVPLDAACFPAAPHQVVVGDHGYLPMIACRRSSRIRAAS